MLEVCPHSMNLSEWMKDKNIYFIMESNKENFQIRRDPTSLEVGAPENKGALKYLFTSL